MIALAGEDFPGAPGCLPNARQKLLLKAACGATDTAREAWLRWREGSDLTSIDAVAARLLPWIYHRRDELRLSAGDMAALESGYRYAWFRNQRLLNGASEVVECLTAARIDSILLKGLPLLVEVYGDEGGRYMEDFDIVVREDEVVQAVAALTAIGWQPRVPNEFSEQARGWRHSSELVNTDGLSCDLHWRLLRRPNAPVSEDPVWSAKRPLAIRDKASFTLSVEHAIVHLFVHGMSWHAVPPIRWILDAHLLLSRHTPDWVVVLGEARRRGVMLPVAEAMQTYDANLPGIIPQAVRDEACNFQPTRAQRVAHQMVTRPYESASWEVKLAVYLSDWRKAVAFGLVPHGLRGRARHLCTYLGVDSLSALVRTLAKRCASKIRYALFAATLLAVFGFELQTLV